MDKRGWPWKKKLGEKTSSEAEEPASPSRQFDDQQATTGFSSDHGCVSNVALSQEQADEKIRLLNERLLAADHLVKQHVKVAEEAVSGWEKSKAENMSLKHQLEALMEQKQVNDDKMSYLDGALKESMWQLRQIREEQEQRIHDAIVKKTREWENLKLELQQRLEDADHQLVEAEFQNSLLYKRVKEQAETLAQLGQVRSQAEAKVEMLQVRVETFEKENASLKYEVMILNKELTIRNQEREINKKSLDVASRQKAESARKINKLESECQRLRVLVRKKLPGPGALVQMKLEVEGLDTERGDLHHNKWKPSNKLVSSPKAAFSMVDSDGSVSVRLLTMEEETKMLKEVLAERNNELQTAKSMCAQMAEKLSVLERQQVGQVQNSPRKSLLGYGFHGVDSCLSLSSYKEPSHASLSEDGIDDERSVADSWASALITELACFQKGRVPTPHQSRESLYSRKVSDRLDSVADFIEVERLVSLPSEQPGMEANKENAASTTSKEAFAAQEAELQAANMQCSELKSKLVLAEEQLSALSSKNAANELNLFSLQHKLNMVLANIEEGDETRAMEEVRSTVLASQCSSVDGLQAHVMKLSKVSSPSVSSETPPLERSSCPRSPSPSCDEKLPNNDSELRGAIDEAVRLLEELVSESKAQHERTSCGEDCQSGNSENSCVHHITDQKTLEPDLTLTNFKSIIYQFLQGKVELIEILRELSKLLTQMKIVGPSTSQFSLSQKHEAFKTAEQEVFSDAGSPFSSMSNCDGSEHPVIKVSPAGERLSTLREPQVDEELRNSRAEKAALESHMKAELRRMDKLEEMLTQLQQEKSELICRLEEEKEKVETAKGQLLDSEQLIASLRVRLASAEISRNMAGEQLSLVTAEKSKLESQLHESQGELNKMHEMLTALGRSMDEKHTRNKELHAKVEELQSLLERASMDKSHVGVEYGTEKSIQDHGIVNASEKLAECQRTILALGKQIQNMASARASVSLSFNSSARDTPEGLPKDDIERLANGGTIVSRGKQRVRSDPGNFSTSDITDEELLSAAKGKGKAELFNEKPATHEEYIQAVSQQLPSSPEADSRTQIVPYVSPKTAAGKKKTHPLAGAVDLAKSLNLGSPASPRRGNSLSRFFSRNKKGV